MTEKTNPILKKYPIPSPQEENIEQAVSYLWQMKEQGQAAAAETEKTLDEIVAPGALRDALSGRLVEARGSEFHLTQKGERLAQNIVRRHRLTERLLSDILDMAPEQLDPNACRLEHVITADVEEAICTLLGHPKECPHGCLIPEGSCCRKALGQTGPVVSALSALDAGQEGRIAYLSPRNRPELHRLLSLGFIPGALLRVTQVYPAVVVSLGPSLLALDPVLAQHIFVRKKTGS